MRRSEAGRLLDHGSYLTTAEKIIYLILLERSDNSDCTIPQHMTPRASALAGRAGLSLRTVRRALRHLAIHGWATYEPARGRGHRATIQLAPRQPDDVCTCREKGDTSDLLPPLRKADTSDHLPGRKEDSRRPEKRTQKVATSQVRPQVVRRAVEGEVREGAETNDHETATDPTYVAALHLVRAELGAEPLDPLSAAADRRFWASFDN